MSKIVLLFLLIATNVASAEDFFIQGDTYSGQPIVCGKQNDADELAEIYANKGIKEFSNILNAKNREHLCFAGAAVVFTPLKEVSAHRSKETMYVIEVKSSEIYYIVTLRRIINLTKKSVPR